MRSDVLLRRCLRRAAGRGLPARTRRARAGAEGACAGGVHHRGVLVRGPPGAQDRDAAASVRKRAVPRAFREDPLRVCGRAGLLRTGKARALARPASLELQARGLLAVPAATGGGRAGARAATGRSARRRATPGGLPWLCHRRALRTSRPARQELARRADGRTGLSGAGNSCRSWARPATPSRSCWASSTSAAPAGNPPGRRGRVRPRSGRRLRARR